MRSTLENAASVGLRPLLAEGTLMQIEGKGSERGPGALEMA